MSQIEFLDLRRKVPRPAGGGQIVCGYFVFNEISQEARHVAYTLNCTPAHIYHQIDEGDFENATDISSDTAARPCYRIPREDVLAYIETRRVGAK